MVRRMTREIHWLSLIAASPAAWQAAGSRNPRGLCGCKVPGRASVLPGVPAK